MNYEIIMRKPLGSVNLWNAGGSAAFRLEFDVAGHVSAPERPNSALCVFVSEIDVVVNRGRKIRLKILAQ